jgi:Fe-S cluster assembly ATP-binding protein
MLKIKDLRVEVDGKPILDGFSLSVKANETHAIMGPNGSGKSTLCYALLGHPKYKITGGRVEFEGKNILKMTTDERARLGIFMGFQYPREVAGITSGNFLRQINNLRNKKQTGVAEYFPKAKEIFKSVSLGEDFIGRGINEGFSGGEKKRAEIAQMAAFQPKLALLDEIDSGLDIDSLKKTAKAVEKIKKLNGTGLILITHYQRLLHYLPVDRVHVMIGGKLVASGGKELVKILEKEGYQKFK